MNTSNSTLNNIRKVLITAGPTYERIDPVRFIGNYSSGKMGIALAEQCLSHGLEVELILGPVSQHIYQHLDSPLLHITHVESANDMYEACMRIYPTTDAAILCAAVADFTPEVVADQKIKRKGEMVIRLIPTHDIAAALGKVKTDRQLLVGFALETNDEEQNARGKMQRKNFDFIVLNSLQDEGAGFRHDTNKITIIDKTTKTEYPLKTKHECADDIVEKLLKTPL